MERFTKLRKKGKAKVKGIFYRSDSTGSASKSGTPDLGASNALNDATTGPAWESHVDNENTSDLSRIPAGVQVKGNDVGITFNKGEVELKDQEEGANNAAKLPAQDAKQESLWARAYRSVEEDVDFSSYLDKYNDFVRKEIGRAPETVTETDDTEGGPLNCDEEGKSLERVQSWAKEKLDGMCKQKLKVAIGDKQIVVRDTLEQCVTFIDRHKAVVTSIMAAEPSAALAWGGIMAVFPMLLNVFKQPKGAVEGFEQVVRLLITGQLIEDNLRLRSKNAYKSMARAKVMGDIQENLILLYAQAFRYQVRIVLHFNRSAFVLVARDALLLDDWSSMLKDAEKAAQNVERQANQLANTNVGEIYEMCRNIEAVVQDDTADKELEHLDKLSIAGGALFNSRAVAAAGKCLEGTHTGALDAIKTWVQDPNGKHLYWLRGLPGTGKSTIALTAAEFLDQAELGTGLGASFFFSRADQNRNCANKFFCTIAWCLGHRVPELRPHIAQAIINNSNLPNAENGKQLNHLILKPIQSLAEDLSHRLQLFLVIDALDECYERDAEQILVLLRNLENLCQIRLRVLVTSRSGTFVDNLKVWQEMGDAVHQQARLDKVQLKPPTRGTFFLDAPIQAYVADDDITRFMTQSLLDIATRHGFPEGWASEENFLQLRQRTEGLFIYASVACKFFDRPYEEDSDLALRWRDILHQDQELEESTPEHHLVHQVYNNVLLSYYTSKRGTERQKAADRTKRILGTIAILYEPVTVAVLADLLAVTEKDLIRQLSPFGSVVNLPTDNEAIPLNFVHPTFREYILSAKHCPSEVAVNTESAHLNLVRVGCLPRMRKLLHLDMCDLEAPGTYVSDIAPGVVEKKICGSLRYSCTYWVDHLTNSNSNERAALLDDDGAVHDFLRQCFLFWFEVLGLIKRIDVPVLALRRLLAHDMLDATQSPELFSFVQDALYFVRENRIVEHAPLQIYCSGMLFHPYNNVISTQFKQLIPPWLEKLTPTRLTTETSVQTTSTPLSYVLEPGHDGIVKRLVYSADGTLLLSGDDCNFKIWDTSSGIMKISVESKGFLASSISPDGKLAVFAELSKPDVISLLDIETNEPAGELTTAWKDHERGLPLCILSFSGDGRILLSALNDVKVTDILVWSMTTREVVREMRFSTSVDWAQLSYDGRILVTSEREDVRSTRANAVHVWDVESGKMLYAVGCRPEVMEYWPTPFLTGCGTSLRVTVVNTVGEISTWRLGEQGPSRIFEGSVSAIRGSQYEFDCLSCHLSEMGEEVFVFGAGKGELIFYRPADEHRDALETRFFTGNSESLCALALTSDGTQLASGPWSGKIRLWDIRKALSESNNGKEHSGFQIEDAMFVPESENLIVVRYRDRESKDLESGEDDTRPNTIIWNSDEGIANITQIASDEVYDTQIRRVEMSGDGKLALSFYGHDREEGLYRVNYLDPRSLGSTLPDVFEPVKDVRFNLDRSAAALWDGKASIKVLDLSRKRAVVGFKAFSDPRAIDQIALSTDGLLLACATERGRGKFDVQVWDLVDRTRRHAIELDCAGENLVQVRSLDFSPDGSLLLLQATNQIEERWRKSEFVHSRLIDMETGEERGHDLPKCPALSETRTAKFSPDSMALFFQGRNDIKLFNLKEQGSSLTTLCSYSDMLVHTTCVSPDSQLLAVSILNPTPVSNERVLTVDVWNISATSRIWRKSFTDKVVYWHRLYLLSFSKNEDRLESISGRIPWSRATSRMDLSSHSGVEMAQSDLWDCFYIGREWIFQGDGKRLIWLPPKFQTNYRTAVAAQNGRIFLSSEFGELMAFKIHLEKTPMANGKNGHGKRGQD